MSATCFLITSRIKFTISSAHSIYTAFTVNSTILVSIRTTTTITVLWVPYANR